jgi:hypothetical protein
MAAGPPPTIAAHGRPGRLAFLGLALGLAGVLGYFVVVFRLGAWLPRVRNDAVPNWILVGAGVALSGLAIVRAAPGRRLLPGVLAALNVAVAAGFAALLYVVSAVPGADGPALGAMAPDFALPDQTGRIVRRGEFAGRPLLLVFYRGHW